jgi:hypothetical protein
VVVVVVPVDVMPTEDSPAVAFRVVAVVVFVVGLPQSSKSATGYHWQWPRPVRWDGMTRI